MWISVVYKWYSRCTFTWIGNRKHTRISSRKTIMASTT